MRLLAWLGAERHESEWPDAARMLKHFLEGSGKTIDPGVGKMLADIPAFSVAVDRDYQGLRRRVEDHVRKNFRGDPITFDVRPQWRVMGGIDTDTVALQNWFYAMNGFSYAHSARVTVRRNHDGAALVSIDPRLQVFDRYNWDKVETKVESRSVSTRMIKDAQLAELHKEGLARDFEIIGALDRQRQTIRMRLNLPEWHLDLRRRPFPFRRPPGGPPG